MRKVNKIWNYKFSGIVSAFFMTISVLILKIVDKVTSSLFILNIDEHGKNIIIHRGLKYRYPNVIRFGNNIIVGIKTKFSSEIKDSHYLHIEDGVSIGNNNEIDFTGGIIIRQSAHIAHNVLISTHDHGFDYRNKPVGKALEIGEYAFIGSKSIIMHNCNYIGKHAVIGSGSVVTKDVPDFAVVAGNPARIIKYINGDGKES